MRSSGLTAFFLLLMSPSALAIRSPVPGNSADMQKQNSIQREIAKANQVAKIIVSSESAKAREINKIGNLPAKKAAIKAEWEKEKAALERKRNVHLTKAARLTMDLYDLWPDPSIAHKSVMSWNNGDEIRLSVVVQEEKKRVNVNKSGELIPGEDLPEGITGATFPDGLMIMFPRAFENGIDYLASMLYHETIHFKLFTTDGNKFNTHEREEKAYLAQKFANPYFKLNQLHLQNIETQIKKYHGKSEKLKAEERSIMGRLFGEKGLLPLFSNGIGEEGVGFSESERKELLKIELEAASLLALDAEFQALVAEDERKKALDAEFAEFKAKREARLEQEQRRRELEAEALEQMARQMKKEREERFERETETRPSRAWDPLTPSPNAPREPETRPSRAWVFPTYSEEEQAIRNWIFKLFAEAKKCGHFPGRTLPSDIENSWARSYDRYIEFLATYNGWDEGQGFDLGYSFGFQLHGDLEVMKARFLMRNACENVWNSNLVQPCNDSFNLVLRSWKDESFRYGWLTITDGNFAARSCLSHMYKNENSPRDWDDLARRIKKYRDAVNAKNERISREADEAREKARKQNSRAPYRSRPETRDCLWGNCVDLPSGISVPSL